VTVTTCNNLKTKTRAIINKCLHQVFEEVAKHHLDEIALFHNDKQISYAQLENQANQLAHHLMNLEINQESIIAVHFDRSINAVIALLAILKAGCAYLPLDPNSPIERSKFMINNAKASILIAENETANNLFNDGLHVIYFGAHNNAWHSLPTTPPKTTIQADNLASIIYTSGSTGIPKGVAVNHKNIVARVKCVDYVDLRSSDNILHMAPLAFDAATFEIWGALLNGGSVVIADKNLALEPEKFRQTLKTKNVTKLFVTTALFNRLVTYDPDIFETVDQVLFGGEKVNPKTVYSLLNASSPRQLSHVYGPTEAVIFSTAFNISDKLLHIDIVPIGRAIDNTQTYVVNSEFEQCINDEIGELFIGGLGVARGYWNQPGLTADRFVPNPFGVPGERIYRTGDLVQLSADGFLEFVKRVDHQVKIRGYRVELGEIETVLKSHSSVSDAIITLQEGEEDSSLSAFVIPNDECFSVAEIRNYLKHAIPAYMVPSVITALYEFPMNSNGKVERSALPKLTKYRELDVVYIEPRTPLEQEIANIWSNVLELGEIGVRDNFFDLGGHSLLVMRVVARIRELIDIELPIRTVFEKPTIEELSKEALHQLQIEE